MNNAMQEGLGVNNAYKLKQHNLGRYICLLAAFFLVVELLPINSGHAIVSRNLSINSSGTIVSPPTPTPEPSPSNLAVLPDFFIGTGREIDFVYTKYPVTWQGKSNCIEMDWNPNNAISSYNQINELNGRWLSVKPGDRIIWRAWLYTEDQTSVDTTPWRGAILCIDIYGDGVKCEIGGPNGEQSYTFATDFWCDRTGCVAGRNTNIWTLAQMDFVVKSQYESWPTGELFTPTSFTCIIINNCCGDYVSQERGRIWVWNPELCIYRDGAWL
jgi:hypothetical protein